MKAFLLPALLAISVAASAQTAGPAVPAGHPPMPGHPPMAGHPPIQDPAAQRGVQEYRLPAELFQTPRMQRPAAAARNANEGTVLQVQTAGGYTYIEVSGAQGNQWLAAPAMNIAAGTRIRYESGAVMANFTSKAINRTFPTIIFVGAVEPVMATEGTVVQTQTAGGYSYIEVKSAKGSEWLAAPEMQVKAGDTVRYEGGSVMHNFTSGSLKRTFPSILFVGGVEIVAPR